MQKSRGKTENRYSEKRKTSSARTGGGSADPSQPAHPGCRSHQPGEVPRSHIYFKQNPKKPFPGIPLCRKTTKRTRGKKHNREYPMNLANVRSCGWRHPRSRTQGPEVNPNRCGSAPQRQLRSRRAETIYQMALGQLGCHLENIKLTLYLIPNQFQMDPFGIKRE